MNYELDPQDEMDVPALVRDLKSMRENLCAGCRAQICGHEALMSLIMGFKDTPRCWQCLSTGLEHDSAVLRDRLFALVERRSCYHGGWLWANREEGFESGALPGCLWPIHSVETAGKQTPLSPAVQNRAFLSDIDSDWDAEWDAGDMACGDLVLELRTRLQLINPGQTLKVLARDTGAEEDLPAWCRVTGNTLVAAQHPAYLIKRKVK